MFRIFLITAVFVLPGYSIAARGQENSSIAKVDSAVKTESAVKSEVVLSNLANPWGVAVQPGSGDLFISESGAGQIIRVKATETNNSTPAITGFAIDTFNAKIPWKIGPLGLAFLDKITLAVGEGSIKSGSDLVRIYQLPEDGKPLTADDTKQKLGPIEAGSDSSKGEGGFFGVTSTVTAVYVTSCAGDPEKGWILKADLSGTTAGQMKPFIKSTIEAGASNPLAITASVRGELVVGQAGKIEQAKDSVLSFYNSKSGKLLLNLPVALHDIAGLAYSPKGKLLYTIDSALSDTKNGGLYRLDSAIVDGKQTVKATKLLSLDRPTSLAFSPEGTLYITTLGRENADGDQKTGQLLRLTGEF